MPNGDLTNRQLELIAKLAALEPTLSFMGGYAEDALLAGRVTREHDDVDVTFPRHEQDLRLAQLAKLGFANWETWGEAAPGVPFYLFGQSGELRLDLGLCDEDDGSAGCGSTNCRSRSAASKRPLAISCSYLTTSSISRRSNSRE